MSSDTNDNTLQTAHNSGEMILNRKECTSCEQNNIDNITEVIDGVVLDDMSNMSKCANCGKEGNSNDMNACNKCQSVKYCNAECKKKHRKKHKLDCGLLCERRAAELYDEQLFKDPPPRDECPICMLTLLYGNNTETFKPCCGKTVCSGCIYAILEREGGVDKCPFCRAPEEGRKGLVQKVKKQMDRGNAGAFDMLGSYYAQGKMGLPQNGKACELWLKAGELGCAEAYYNLGVVYDNGMGVKMDRNKAKHYWELAAVTGNVKARFNIGCMELKAGNVQRSYKHFVIAARSGDERALGQVKKGFMECLVTKDEYANTLRAYHERQKEMKSEMRDKAAASGIFSR